MRKLVLVLSLAVLLLAPLRAQDGDAPKQDGKPKAKGRVLLITLDAFRPEAYREDRFPMPVLKALAARGVQAKRCVGVFPTLTYPSHTSIVTGVRTGKHMILSNTIFDPKDGGKRWYYEADRVKVP